MQSPAGVTSSVTPAGLVVYRPRFKLDRDNIDAREVYERLGMRHSHYMMYEMVDEDNR